MGMGIQLVRVGTPSNIISWGILSGTQVEALDGPANSLNDFLKSGGLSARKVTGTFSLDRLSFLSPITVDAQIICQGKNYLTHLLETGIKPENKEFNLIFSKASSSIAPPSGKLHRPSGVELLDYELELGVVLGAELHCPTKVTRGNLHQFIAGIVMANDISARDVQVPERQWFKGKSFRGFCPLGPVLYLLEQHEIAQLYDLDLRLFVNGKLRQNANTKQLMYSPEATLSELSEIIDLRPGDLLLTGTPGGVAMQVKKTVWRDFSAKFSGEKAKMKRFLAEQRANPRYLNIGDRIESTISSPDGRIDLGRQELIVSE